MEDEHNTVKANASNVKVILNIHWLSFIQTVIKYNQRPKRLVNVVRLREREPEQIN